MGTGDKIYSQPKRKCNAILTDKVLKLKKKNGEPIPMDDANT